MDVLIVDDEPLACQRLARMVEQLDGCRVVGLAGSTAEAMAALREQDPDVVLLDVRMPGEDGLSAAHQIAELDSPPAIIFCTAYDQYAVDAFGTQAVGYLMKPVKAEALGQALEKARRLNKVQMEQARQRFNPGAAAGRNHITAKTRRGVELIPMDNVRFFMADQKYVTVHHTEGEHLLDETLKELEEEFGDRLLRIHRNALVSVQHIEGLERSAEGQYQVRLTGVTARPTVSRRHASDLKALLQKL